MPVSDRVARLQWRPGIAAALAPVLGTLLSMPVPSTAAGADAAASAASQPGYKVGDRLVTKTKAGKSAGGPVRQIEWDDLMPADWNPMAGIRMLQFAKLGDGDPKATEALEKLKKAWAEAPIEPALDKQHVVIAGFALPLEGDGKRVRELLLVPYFGACIHTPPPPSNQVIHVVLDKPAKDMHMMDTVWVTGTLHVESATTAIGASGYKLDSEKIVPYVGGTHP